MHNEAVADQHHATHAAKRHDGKQGTDKEFIPVHEETCEKKFRAA